MPDPPSRSLSYILVGRVLENVLTVVLLAALARAGPEVLGVYYLARAVAATAAELSELGSSRLLIRALAGACGSYRPVFGAVLLGRIGVAIVAFGAVYLVVTVLMNPSPPTVRAVLALTAAFLVMGIADLFLDVLRAGEQMRLPAILNAGSRAMFVGVALAGLWRGRGLDWVVFTLLAISVVHLGVAAVLVLRRHGLPSWVGDLGVVPDLVREAKPFAAAMILGALSSRIVVWLLYAYWDDRTLGEYGAAFYLVEALMLFAFAVTSAAFPKLTADFKTLGRLDAEGPAAVTKLLLSVVMPITVGTVLVAPAIVDFLYGAEYTASVPLLRLGILAAAALFLNSLFFTLLQVIGRTSTGAWLLLPVIVVNTGVGLLLVSRFGAMGAVATTVGAQWLLVGMNLLALRRSLSTARAFEGFRGLVLAVSGMAVPVMIVRDGPLIVAVLLGAVTYLILALMFYPLNAADRLWLRSTLARPGRDRAGGVI